jgi:acyl-coenzyme A thioesterase PaaI-like protein
VLEAAAMEVTDDSLQVQSWTVTMLRPGTHGPFRAEAVALRTGARVPVQLTLFDEGRDDRAVATALAVYAEA